MINDTKGDRLFLVMEMLMGGEVLEKRNLPAGAASELLRLSCCTCAAAAAPELLHLSSCTLERLLELAMLPIGLPSAPR